MSLGELSVSAADARERGLIEQSKPKQRRVLNRTLHGVPVHVERRIGFYERHIKRPLDIVGAAGLIVAASPLLGASWLALRIALGPGVVITQERVGRDGRIFGMYKFRTMKHSRRRERQDYNGPDRRLTHKHDADPRHTRIGRAMRKASIDELPQLFNVLNGDMSLVGPRPELAAVIETHGGRDHSRHTIRPGLTGEWQVTTRQTGALLHECFDEDLPYLNRITLRNDLRILVATIAVVANRGGH